MDNENLDMSVVEESSASQGSVPDTLSDTVQSPQPEESGNPLNEGYPTETPPEEIPVELLAHQMGECDIVPVASDNAEEQLPQDSETDLEQDSAGEVEPEPQLTESETAALQFQNAKADIARATLEAEEARKRRFKLWKKEAKSRARAYLKEKRACKTKDEKKAKKQELKDAKKAWRKSLRALGKEDRQDQRKAYRVFKKRLKLVPRIISWVIIIALLAGLVYFGAPNISTLLGVLNSQKYKDTGEAADNARAVGAELSARICDEGYVLLKNDDSFLPLKDKKLNVFGDDAYNFVYGGSGSAGADQSGAISLFTALEEAGISYNKALDAVYTDTSDGSGSGSTWEMVKTYLTGSETQQDWKQIDDTTINEAYAFSNQALIVLSSQEVEGSEIDPSLLTVMRRDNPMQIRRQVVDTVCRQFDHVIIVINSGNVMELGFLEDYPNIDACIWVGSPGFYGCRELARVIVGEVNPSGRTVDTWPASIEDNPAYITYGDNSYSNISGTGFFTYNEGIYVGYRYYETRYGDSAEYDQHVVFPFGYGLSYTSFQQTLTGVREYDGRITVTVRVENTGDVAGRDVVQVYFMAPWYKGSGIEKSAIELAGFTKTSELKPGGRESVRISFDVRDMASWSSETAGGCWILEKGDYRIAIGSNVHDALTGDQYKIYSVEDNIRYSTDETTGTKLSNRFTEAEGNILYLSRADWVGTYPVAITDHKADKDTLSARAGYNENAKTYYTLPKTEPAYSQNNSIVLADLKGLEYDDPAWDKFLDQFTIDEMIDLVSNGGWHTKDISRLGVPKTRLLDGPSGINAMFASVNSVAYPMETVVSSSWDVSIAKALGEAIGDEANAYGVNGWYGPAMNIHRIATGGRNNEYYSEDPLLSGQMAAASVQGVQSKGVIAFMKHFVTNDVELNARSGVYNWLNEQSLREIYLKPFEMSVKEGGAAGAMSSFTHLGTVWCGGSPELLYDVLRQEWGFKGVVTTDAVLGGFMDAAHAVKSGNDLMLDMGLVASVRTLEKAYATDPVSISWGVRNSVHNICYAIVNYTTAA